MADKNIIECCFFLPLPRVPAPPKLNDGAEEVGKPPAAGVVPKPNEGALVVVVPNWNPLVACAAEENVGAPKPNEGGAVDAAGAVVPKPPKLVDEAGLRNASKFL